MLRLVQSLGGKRNGKFHWRYRLHLVSRPHVEGLRRVNRWTGRTRDRRGRQGGGRRRVVDHRLIEHRGRRLTMSPPSAYYHFKSLK